MTLATMALFADGRTRLTHIGSWRVKETDRIAAMATELRKLGATVVDGADFIEVERPAVWRRATLRTYDDHRMAMCLSLAAFNPLAGGHVPVRVLDPRCVAKTLPQYFETLFDVVQTDVTDIPVITVDGPTASGKGTLAATVAARLGWRQLDSGALYRATALAAMKHNVAASDGAALTRLAGSLSLRFEADKVWLEGIDVTVALRHEAVGALASHVSALRGAPGTAACNCRFGACLTWWPTVATWARVVPQRAAQGPDCEYGHARRATA
jgi:3-phosphoshikimate 1-carboxyvinyltransferase